MTTCHTTGADTQLRTLPAEKMFTIALAGQPNMGKSTLFNLLTGLNQHVGNWPGKTVEHREGIFHHNGRAFRLVDLPGTYSLTANSPEEVIAREFILREQPDIVVAIVSAANLERSLYLVAELICLPAPLVVALNMMDVAEQEGICLEPEVLQAAMGVPVIPITATRAAGIKSLLQEVERVLAGERTLLPHLPEIRRDHQDTLDEVVQQVTGCIPAPYPTEWAAMKLLEGDAEMTRQMKTILPAERWTDVHTILAQHDDAMLAIASGRYEWIGRMIRAAVSRPRIGQISLTDRLDRWATHPVWGLFILAGILGLVFWLTFTLGSPVQAWLDTALISPLAGLAGSALTGAPSWLSALIVDGILGGVGSVLTFLPIMMIFFASFGLLEDIGYMARAAYVMDNFMHLMGLHGKSFLPLFLGFGCNVPAVMGTRVIELQTRPPADHPGRAPGTMHRPHGRPGLYRPGFLRGKRRAGILGVDLAFPGHPRPGWDRPEPHPLQGRALSLHHGDAALPHSKRAHHRPASLAALALFRQEGRHHHPGHLRRHLGAVGPARRRFTDQLPRQIRAARRAGWQLDGYGLEADRRPADQLHGQGKLDRHVGRSLRRGHGRRPGVCPGSRLLPRRWTGFPHRLAALHPLRRDRGRDQAGDRLLGLDSAECRPDAGHLHRCRQRGLFSRYGSRVIKCSNDCSPKSAKGAHFSRACWPPA